MGKETTFPLSNFKAKHIFRIVLERVTFLKSYGALEAPEIWGAEGAPIFFFRRPRRRKLTARPERPRGAPIFFISFIY